jgi:DNA-binding transcriptional regulator GbsR (MarR family)
MQQNPNPHQLGYLLSFQSGWGFVLHFKGRMSKRNMSRKDILKILRSAKTFGLTASQIALRIGKSKRFVHTAFADLQRQNLVAKTGHRRDRAEIWIALDTHDSGPVDPGVPIK